MGTSGDSLRQTTPLCQTAPLCQTTSLWQTTPPPGPAGTLSSILTKLNHLGYEQNTCSQRSTLSANGH